MNENERVIREFIEAWSRLDANELADYFTEDGVYFNVPVQPVGGRDNVRKFIRDFIATWNETQWDVRTIVATDDVVVAERVDRIYTTAGDVDLPCVGVFEMQGGRIREWRDYFDLGTYMKAMQG